MKIPSSISKNCLKTYSIHNGYAKKVSVTNSQIYLERWDLKIPKRLQELCVECLAKNWADYPILDEIILQEDKYLLLEELSEELPIDLTILKIHDDVYWKKCYLKRWPNQLPNIKELADSIRIVKNGINNINGTFINDTLRREDENDKISDHGSAEHPSGVSSRRSSRKSIVKNIEENFKEDFLTWKRCYIEKHVQEYFRTLKPENYNPEMIKDLCDLCGSYVKALRIDQMLCSKNCPNKIPLNGILTGFPNLKEVHLCFKQVYAEEDFSWNILNTSYHDINLLAKGLEKLRLHTIRITNSDIDCDKVTTILKALLKHEIQIIDFSHCKIANRGMLAIAKFLMENPVQEMYLGNNKIGPQGVYPLAYALSQDCCKLQLLDLKLNQFYSDMGNLLIETITRNNGSLKSLTLSGCGLTKNLKINKTIQVNKTLQTLDISNNILGEVLGEKILEAMKGNVYLKKLDLRITGINSICEAKIQDEIHKNRKGVKKFICAEQTCKSVIFEWSRDVIQEIEEVFFRNIVEH